MLSMPHARAAQSLADLMACRAIADSGPRLACFDRATAALAGSASLATPPALATPPTTPPALATAVAASNATVSGGSGDAEHRTMDFGLSPQAIIDQQSSAKQRPQEVTHIDARLTRIAREADGRVVFVLDNAQQWRQLTAQGDLLAEVGQSVTISRELFGSYFLRTPSGRGCKVTRLASPAPLSR
jgi:hypothetical protein